MVIQYKPTARRRILWDNFLLDKFFHWKKDIVVPILLGWRNIRFYKDICILFIHNWNPITAAIREALGVRKLRHDITGLENASVHALTSSLWSALHSLMSIQNVSAWPSVRWKKNVHKKSAKLQKSVSKTLQCTLWPPHYDQQNTRWCKYENVSVWSGMLPTWALFFQKNNVHRKNQNWAKLPITIPLKPSLKTLPCLLQPYLIWSTHFDIHTVTTTYTRWCQFS